MCVCVFDPSKILFLCVCFVRISVCVCGSQKRALDLLELELQMIVSYHVCAGYRTLVLWKSSQCSYLLSLQPPPPFQ